MFIQVLVNYNKFIVIHQIRQLFLLPQLFLSYIITNIYVFSILIELLKDWIREVITHRWLQLLKSTYGYNWIICTCTLCTKVNTDAVYVHTYVIAFCIRVYTVYNLLYQLWLGVRIYSLAGHELVSWIIYIFHTTGKRWWIFFINFDELNIDDPSKKWTEWGAYSSLMD